MALSPVMVELRAGISEFSAKMAEARAEVTKLQTEGSANMAKFQSVGKAATIGLVAGVVAVGVESLKMAGDFEKDTNVLVTAAGESAKALGTVRAGILEIARSTGTSWQSLTEGMYTVEKAGYRGADGLKVLTAAAQGAKEENASLASVTDAMTSIMASYHLSAANSVQVMNGLKTAAGESKTTMEEFAASLSTVIPIASANKISIGEVSGAIATLTQHGTSADEATQELANTIRSLAAPNNVAKSEMQQLGINVTDLSTKMGDRGLSGTIDVLVNAISSHMGPAGTLLLNSFKQSQAAGADMKLMLDQMDPATRKLAESFTDGQMTSAQWTKTVRGMTGDQADLARQFTVVYNRANGFNDLLRAGSPAAQTMTDALKKMAGGATGLNTILMLSGENTAAYKGRVDEATKSFNDASTSVEGWDSTQKLFNVRMDMLKQSVEAAFISIGMHLIPVVGSAMDLIARHKTTVEVLVAAIGTALVAAITAYIASLTVAAAKSIANFAKMLAAGAQWVAEQIAGFASLMASIAVVVATYTALAVRTAAQYVAMGAAAVASSAVQVGAWVAAAAAATAAFIAENAATLGIAAAIAALITAVVYAATHWSQVWGTIKSVASAAADWIKSHLLLIGAAFGPLGIGLALLAQHWSQVWGAITSVVRTAYNDIKPIVDAIASAVSSVANAASTIGNIAGSVGGALSHIPGFATGVQNYRGGLALVGEQGPELVSLPRGTNVYTAPQTSGMLGTDMSGVESLLGLLIDKVDRMPGQLQTARRQA